MKHLNLIAERDKLICEVKAMNGNYPYGCGKLLRIAEIEKQLEEGKK